MTARANHEFPASRNGDWIVTYSGCKFWPCDPLPEEVHIADIAHHLSMICRFTGAVREFYSVAQHSILCSRIVPECDAKWGLLHDATEAYIADVSRPVKPYLSNYESLERQLHSVIADRFGLPQKIPPSIHKADDILVCTERRDLLGPGPSWGQWANDVRLLEKRIIAIPPQEAERLFLERFTELFPEEP